jgi:UDP-N-acetylmuramyl pentapeptide phosphotransferase/UDP-N-acetylglucosamine-1-phosphate transferase
MRGRLLGSLTLGAIVAAVVVIYDDKANHAALVASAARNHSTVMASLVSGFTAITLVVALIVFVAATLRARRRRGRAERAWQPGPARRRSRAGAGW